MRRSREESGFTLLELLVTVLVIGILVAVAIPVLNGATNSAKRRTCSENLRTLDGAAAQWALAEGLESADSLDTLDDARDALSTYVVNFDRAATCTTALGVVSIADGDFTCSIADHNYE